MSDLGFNKIAGAALATGLAILGLRALADGIYQSHPPAKPGYAIQVAEETGGAEAAVADVPPDWGAVLPIADIAAGETQSKKCTSCHSFEAGGKNGTGPNQYGVVGRKPASHAGFDYSKPMIDFGAKTPAWTYEALYEYLKAPASYIPGNRMTFVGMKGGQERINLIAWLRTQAASPAPIPAPNPAAVAAAAPAASDAPAAVAAAPAAGH